MGAMLAAGLNAPAALAHRTKTALTRISWSDASKTIQIIHRLHAHDAEFALATVSGTPAQDLGQTRTQARLALYVRDRFSLLHDGNLVDLEIVGAELEGAHILVYQEAAASAPMDALNVSNAVFHDVFPDQVNRVNISMGKGVRTLVFTASDGFKTVDGLA
ncbi:MAG: DUF6702 family protein [Pseudomonadota bacterium]